MEKLAGFHRSRIARLLESSQQRIRLIFALYVAFLVVGGALVVVASVAASRGIASPLRRLADAVQEIAEGRLETRVRVRSRNEIGLLSHTFNVMADRLQEHDGELQSRQGALEEKVREAQALYRVGMEISRLRRRRPGPPVRRGHGAGAAARRRRGAVPLHPRARAASWPRRGAALPRRSGGSEPPTASPCRDGAGVGAPSPSCRSTRARISRPPCAWETTTSARSTSARARSGTSPRTRPSCSPAWPRRRPSPSRGRGSRKRSGAWPPSRSASASPVRCTTASPRHWGCST